LTAESLETLLGEIRNGYKPFTEFSPADQALIEKFSQKRGNPNEPFRIDERVTARVYRVPDAGKAVASQVRSGGTKKEAARLTPELLKHGSWRQVGVRKF